MRSPELVFKAYRRTQHLWDGFGAYHGEYDGLSTGEYVHDHLQILVPLKGRIHLALAGEAHLLGPERAIALPAGTRHAASTLGGVFEFVALNTPADWLGRWCGELGLPPPTPARAVLLADPGVWLEARQLAGVLDDPAPGHERFLAAGLEQLGWYVARACGRPSGEPARTGAVERAVAAMLARYADDVSVAELAAELALGPRQLERRFKAELGVSPRRFLIDVRLAAARELLATTDLPIEAVGARVGFGDASHFARTFRAATGVTPGGYRRGRRS